MRVTIMMIRGLLIVFLEALSLIVANPLPADSIDSNQLLWNYLDPIVLQLVPDLGNQGSLPSVDLSTSTHDSLESIAAAYPAGTGSEASADVCENEGLQPGVQTNTKLRKRQGKSCASQFKNSAPSTITSPKPISPANPGEQLFTLPPASNTDNNACKKPFVNRYCCDGPLGRYIQAYHSTFPNGFYSEVYHCLDCKFLWSKNGAIFSPEFI